MRTERIAFKLGLPGSLSIETVARWLDTIAATTHPPRFALIQPPPVVVEVVAGRTGISHYLIVPVRQRRMVLSSLRAALPVRLDDAADYLEERPRFHLAADLAVAGSRMLAHERGQAANAAVLAAMQPLHGDERVVVQLVTGSAGTPPPTQSNDADQRRAERNRQRHPGLRLAVRVGIAAKRRDRAGGLLHGVIGGMRLLNAPGAQITKRRLPSWVIADRLHHRPSQLPRHQPGTCPSPP